jgi:hypothetical protein
LKTAPVAVPLLPPRMLPASPVRGPFGPNQIPLSYPSPVERKRGTMVPVLPCRHSLPPQPDNPDKYPVPTPRDLPTHDWKFSLPQITIAFDPADLPTITFAGSSGPSKKSTASPTWREHFHFCENLFPERRECSLELHQGHDIKRPDCRSGHQTRACAD